MHSSYISLVKAKLLLACSERCKNMPVKNAVTLSHRMRCLHEKIGGWWASCSREPLSSTSPCNLTLNLKKFFTEMATTKDTLLLKVLWLWGGPESKQNKYGKFNNYCLSSVKARWIILDRFFAKQCRIVPIVEKNRLEVQKRTRNFLEKLPLVQ